MRLQLGHVVHALSDTIDLVDGRNGMHGKRVAYLACVVAERLGWSEPAVTALCSAALLHDCGISSTREHERLVHEPDAPEADRHCREGAARIAAFPTLAPLAPVIRAHHTPWARLADTGLDDDQRARANLILLADRVDGLLARHGGHPATAARDWLARQLADWPGTLCAPGSVDALLACAATDDFWRTLQPEELARYLRHRHQLPPHPLDLPAFHRVAVLFARIVDAKSPFTRAHSAGVARLAGYLAEQFGFDAGRRARLEIAALLHDIGKLRVPDEIIDKPAPLTRMERAVMRRHSYDTMQILARIRGLGEIARWASAHHETLEGGGYPFSPRARDLPLEARILAVADAFQALSQARPYRPGLAVDAIVEQLLLQAAKGRLDGEVVDLAATRAAACYAAAVGAVRTESTAAAAAVS